MLLPLADADADAFGLNELEELELEELEGIGYGVEGVLEGSKISETGKDSSSV
jgi:hypothetical protein